MLYVINNLIYFYKHSTPRAMWHTIQMLLHTLCVYVAPTVQTYIQFLLKTTFPEAADTYHFYLKQLLVTLPSAIAPKRFGAPRNSICS